MQAQAGQDIEAYCNKCKMELDHVVIACKEDRVARVECKTCRNQHAYKHLPKSGTKAKPASKSRAASGKTTRAARQSAFAQATEGRDLSQARRYRISYMFEEGELMQHHVFGVGVVLRLLSDAKVQVAFSDAERVLVHNRTA